LIGEGGVFVDEVADGEVVGFLVDDHFWGSPVLFFDGGCVGEGKDFDISFLGGEGGDDFFHLVLGSLILSKKLAILKIKLGVHLFREHSA
jgi:hypothetical protein